jgi:hypothetical protein
LGKNPSSTTYLATQFVEKCDGEINAMVEGSKFRESHVLKILSWRAKKGEMSRPLHIEEELEVYQDLQLAGPTDTFTGGMEEDNNDGVIDIFDELTSPVELGNVLDTGDVHGSNRDLDKVEVYRGDDPFDLGSNCVGSPVMSFGEFMDNAGNG